MNSREDHQLQAISEVKLIEQMIAAFSTLRLNAGMYPREHNLIADNLNALFDALQKIFKKRTEISIAVSGETLLFEGITLEKGNLNNKKFARSLNNLRIVSVTLSRGVTKEELLRLQKILTSKPEDIWAMGSLQKVLDHHQIKNISLKFLDLSYFDVTEVKNNVQNRLKDRKEMDDDSWQSFIASSMMNGTNAAGLHPTYAGKGSSGSVDFVRRLNEDRGTWDAVTNNYQNMVDQYLRSGDERNKTDSFEVISRINNRIKEFHPHLKDQLLSIAEQAIESSSAVRTEKLSSFPPEMIAEILRRANKEKREISPSFILFFQKLSRIEKKPDIALEDISQKQFDDAGTSSASIYEVEKLIERERYETYIPADYESILKRRTEDAAVEQVVDSEVFDIKNYVKTLESESLNFQIYRVLLALLDEDIDENDYLEFSAKICEAVPDFLMAGNFSFLIDIFASFKRHESEKSSEPIAMRMRAKSCTAVMTETDAIADAIKPFILQEIPMPYMIEFLHIIGPQNVPWLLDLYLETDSPGAQKLILEILAGYGDKPVDEALDRLMIVNPHTARKLLVFLRITGDYRIVPRVKQLMGHFDIHVRFDVVETLLKFNDPDAKAFLQNMIRSKNQFELSHAIVFACRYQLTDIIVELMSFIKTFIILNQDMVLNNMIIKEVVNAQNQQLIPHLEKLVLKKWSLFPNRLVMTKLAVFKSLGDIPRPFGAELIKIGLNSKNDKIRSVCMELIQER